MLRCFIVDDENVCIESLKNFLAEYCPHVTVVDTANSIEEALIKIPQANFDFAFFDIQLEDGLSFEIIDKLEKVDFDIIFATAFDTYAIKAFRYSAIDYLLKPINPLELEQAVSKIVAGNNREIDQRLKVFQTNQSSKKYSNLAIPTSDSIIYIQTDEIVRLEAEGAYTSIYTTGRKPIIASKVLKEYATLLPEEDFIRTHKSHLVQNKFIKEVGNDFLLLKDESKIPLARRRKQSVEQMLKAS